MGPDPEQVNATKKATRGRIKREVEGNQVHSPYAAHENSDPYSAEREKQSAVIIASWEIRALARGNFKSLYSQRS